MTSLIFRLNQTVSKSKDTRSQVGYWVQNIEHYPSTLNVIYIVGSSKKILNYFKTKFKWL